MTNWYKYAIGDMLGQLIYSYFMDESQIRNLVLYVSTNQIPPQTVQDYVQQLSPTLSMSDPIMFQEKNARLMNALEGVNYNNTSIEQVTAPQDQQDQQNSMTSDMNAIQESGSNIEGGQGEATG